MKESGQLTRAVAKWKVTILWIRLEWAKAKLLNHNWIQDCGVSKLQHPPWTFQLQCFHSARQWWPWSGESSALCWSLQADEPRQLTALVVSRLFTAENPINIINHMLWMIVDGLHLLLLQAAPEKKNESKSGETNCKHPWPRSVCDWTNQCQPCACKCYLASTAIYNINQHI